MSDDLRFPGDVAPHSQAGRPSVPRDTVKWILREVRPAFERFAMHPSVRLKGPLVTMSSIACCITVPSGVHGVGPFEARVGTAEPGSTKLDVALSGTPSRIGDQTRDQLHQVQILELLQQAFLAWSEQGQRP